mmetsp:Transcript_57287/g.113830  ORF Transcript_57287/g.113830 Transcript_57287/m.113830 type:complete len:441 (+) Transcript_57287:96-1418(+)
MSTLFVHVGQAGCQLAEALWPVLAHERRGAPDFFHTYRGSPRPRAVLVDAEPKVVSSVLASAPLTAGAEFSFDPTSVAVAESGRGGNFALGYGAETNGQRLLGASPPSPASGAQPCLLDQAVDCIRREVEACHGTHLGTVVLHSLGGGTGSGLGIRLVEEIRDLCPSTALLAASVLPMTLGENPLQCLNSSLALAALQELADGVLLYENDRLLAGAEASPKRGSGAQSIPWSTSPDIGRGTTFAAMNNIVVGDLVPFFCPPNTGQPFDLSDLLAGVCPTTTHRFAQTFSGEAKSTRQGFDIKNAMTALVQAAPRVPRISVASGSVLGSRVVIRGARVTDATLVTSELLERLGGAASWQPFAADLRFHTAPLRSAPQAVRISTMVNWKRQAHVIRAIVTQGRAKHASRAFAHWYERCGLGPENFAHAFEVLDEVAANYEAA